MAGIFSESKTRAVQNKIDELGKARTKRLLEQATSATDASGKFSAGIGALMSAIQVKQGSKEDSPELAAAKKQDALTKQIQEEGKAAGLQRGTKEFKQFVGKRAFELGDAELGERATQSFRAHDKFDRQQRADNQMFEQRKRKLEEADDPVSSVLAAGRGAPPRVEAFLKDWTAQKLLADQGEGDAPTVKGLKAGLASAFNQHFEEKFSKDAKKVKAFKPRTLTNPRRISEKEVMTEVWDDIPTAAATRVSLQGDKLEAEANAKGESFDKVEYLRVAAQAELDKSEENASILPEWMKAVGKWGKGAYDEFVGSQGAPPQEAAAAPQAAAQDPEAPAQVPLSTTPTLEEIKARRAARGL